jgi:hypothetical protein
MTNKSAANELVCFERNAKGMFRIWSDGSLEDPGMVDAELAIYTQGIAAN